MTAVDRAYTQIGEDIVGRVGKCIRVDAISTSDTITINEFDTVLYFTAVKASDMTTVVSGIIAGNVITISTASLTNVAIVALVTGSKER